MIDRNSRDFNFTAQLGILIGLIGAGIIVGALISAGAWISMTGRPVLSMQNDILNPKYYNAIMVIQGITTLFIFFLPVYFFALICYRNPMKFMGFNGNINVKQVALLVGILLLTFPLSGAIAEFTKWIPIPKNWETKFMNMEKDREIQEAALININSFSRYIMSMFIIAFLPAVFEEVCFRGGVQNILVRWFKGPWAAIILTSIIFSIVHLSYYGFFVRFALGIILGLLFYYSANLWLPILFHFLYNGVQVTALYVISSSGKKVPKDIEDNFPVWAGVFALALLCYAFIHFRKISVRQQQKFVYKEPDDPHDYHNWITKES